ncbi:MAG: ribulose-phosphate 3-epimerase [Clostridia bacterium]|nr:ribulose-phosphate 3-epimerase [Clostridia bacterium]
MIKVAPSLLAADFGKLDAEIKRTMAAGADYTHFDVMDNRFVPNMSFGYPVLEAAVKAGLPVDAHLMVVEPEKYIDGFAKAGARIITVHAEATNHIHRALQQIRQAGCLAGIALNPGTTPECLRYLMGDFDLVLVMTVNPGFGGQKMIMSAVEKIAEIRRMLDEAGVDAIIEVDGGVNEKTAPMLVEKGATMLVAGSAFYGAPDGKAFVDHLKALEK